MSSENKNLIINRLKSLVWRVLWMVVAVGLGFLAENLNLFGFSPAFVGIVGLVLGEISKYVNNKILIARGRK